MPTRMLQDSDPQYELLVEYLIGSALSSLYDDTVNQPLPDHILALLEELEATELRRGECD